jgi:predicted phosphodiesterase
MRVAALYDIHGNLPALEAVLDELHREPVDLVVVGGDVFPGPMAGEALDLLLALDLPVRFIHGNGDRVTLDMAEGRTTDTIPEAGRPMIRWAAGRLRSEHRQVVGSWPGTIRIDIDALGEVLFCHATPRNDREIFTRLTPDDRLRPVFANVRGRLVVCGHTHMQFDRWIDDLRVVNAGVPGCRSASRAHTGCSSGRVCTCGAPCMMRLPPSTAFARRRILRPTSLPTAASCSHRRRKRCSSSSRGAN